MDKVMIEYLRATPGRFRGAIVDASKMAPGLLASLLQMGVVRYVDTPPGVVEEDGEPQACPKQTKVIKARKVHHG